MTSATEPIVEPAPAAPPRELKSRQRWLIVALWLAAFGAALAMDRHVAMWVKRAQPISLKGDEHLKLFKRPGDFRYTLIAVALVAAFHPLRARGASLLLAAAATGGLLYNVKWFIGRHRPKPVIEPFTFHPFKGGPLGIFSAENLAMPSGHTCLAFATAHTLAWLMPRWRWALYVVAGLVGVERVLENAHYCSDVVAGAAVGVVSASLVIKVLSPRLGIARPASPAPTKP